MKVVHILPQVAHGSLSWADLTSGGRGVTGSEQAMLYLARAQAEQGYHVLCYLPTETPGFESGVEFLDVRTSWPRLRRADSADVVISWVTADPLRFLGPKPLKVHSIQINDWLMCAFGFEKYVDVFVACSESHRKWLWDEQGNPGLEAPVAIIPNGTDLLRFSGNGGPRIPRRVVYLSSPDRGLHWLLAMWPEIRFAYPDAELHVFYEVQKWLDNSTLLNSEVGMRAKYVVERMKDLGKHGVVLRGAVSPAKLAEELSRASLMVYPCDPVRTTEGFGCAVLDACAAGVVPVITDADAFGEIYDKPESGILVIRRGDNRRWTDFYLEQVLRLLGDEQEQEQRRQQVMSFVRQYDWRVVAGLWTDMMEQQIRRKRG